MARDNVAKVENKGFTCPSKKLKMFQNLIQMILCKFRKT